MNILALLFITQIAFLFAESKPTQDKVSFTKILKKEDLNSDGISEILYINMYNCESKETCYRGKWNFIIESKHKKRRILETPKDWPNFNQTESIDRDIQFKLVRINKKTWGFSIIFGGEGGHLLIYKISNNISTLVLNTQQNSPPPVCGKDTRGHGIQTIDDEITNFSKDPKGYIYGKEIKFIGKNIAKEVDCDENHTQRNFFYLSSIDNEYVLYKKDCELHKKCNN